MQSYDDTLGLLEFVRACRDLELYERLFSNNIRVWTHAGWQGLAWGYFTPTSARQAFLWQLLAQAPTELEAAQSLRCQIARPKLSGGLPNGEHAPVDVTPLSVLTRLEALSVGGCRRLVGVASVEQRLRELHVDECNFEDWTEVARFTKLEELTIVGGNVTTLDWLEGLASIRRLRLHRCRELVDLEPIVRITDQLEHLEIKQIGITKGKFPKPVKDLLKATS